MAQLGLVLQMLHFIAYALYLLMQHYLQHYPKNRFYVALCYFSVAPYVALSVAFIFI